MRFKAKIEVTFKESILEPKGEAVKLALNSKYKNTSDDSIVQSVKNIRIGNIIHAELEEKNMEQAEEIVKKIAEDFLCNPTIEKFHIHLETMHEA